MEYTEHNPLRVFTSFSGYDSQCMALDRLKEKHPGFDYELVGWSEIDRHAIKAHNLVYPQWADRNFGDITKIDWGLVPDFDLFTFSSPCQDWSTAGFQKGGAEGSGTRSSLLWYCENAIREKRPKYMFMENVKNLVSKKFRPLFYKWCERVESYGYKIFWQVLDAKDYGVPQHRERVFAIFIREDVAFPYSFPEGFELKTELKDLLEENVPDCYYLSDKVVEGFRLHNEKHKEKGTGFMWKPKDMNQEGEIANCLRAGYARSAPTDDTIKESIRDSTDAGQAGQGRETKSETLYDVPAHQRGRRS